MVSVVVVVDPHVVVSVFRITIVPGRVKLGVVSIQYLQNNNCINVLQGKSHKPSICCCCCCCVVAGDSADRLVDMLFSIFFPFFQLSRFMLEGRLLLDCAAPC